MSHLIRFDGLFRRWRLYVHRDIDLGWRIAIGRLRFHTHLLAPHLEEPKP